MKVSWTGWRRDMLVSFLSCLITTTVLVPVGLAKVVDYCQKADMARNQAIDAARVAEQKAAKAQEQFQRNMLTEAAKLLRDFNGNGEPNEEEVLRVTSKAVEPEIPEGNLVLIDKKARSFTGGDIVVYRADGKNYLARVLEVDKLAGRLTVGRNGEANRVIDSKDVFGRGVLNTR
jgi:hypothetical protein